MPKITYDPEVKVVNIKICNGKVADSDIQKNCVIDYDKKGKILNIEILEVALEKVKSLFQSHKKIKTL